MTGKPIRISIHALGGQGGGVLADWIVRMAEARGWCAQSTSVPGVAQRTGATVYYVEICPPADRGEPVLALMPAPGDVDVVVALELMEAGRAIARGLVTPERTTLIASTHRVFAISEKSARGDGAFSASTVLDACRRAAKRTILSDLQIVATRHGSVISAAAFGALAASAALPFGRSEFADAITSGRRGAQASLAAFEAVLSAPGGERPEMAEASDRRSRISERVASLPEPVRVVAQLGAERLADYQGRAYVARYLDRVAQVCAAEGGIGPRPDWRLSQEAARRLAVWMSYEDMIWVADLKVRAGRFRRIRTEAHASKSEIVHVTEFMHPRFEELCDVAPSGLARWLLAQSWARSAFARIAERDWQVRSTGLRGFLLLYLIAALRPLRPISYRHEAENQRIDAWLESAVNAARTDYSLGVEILRLQRLVKGYGDTHTRGLRVFAAIMRQLPLLMDRSDAAKRLRELHEAALKEDDGALAAALEGGAGLAV